MGASTPRPGTVEHNRTDAGNARSVPERQKQIIQPGQVV